MDAITHSIHVQNDEFPDEYIPYLIEGLLHQLNHHREVLLEGAKFSSELYHKTSFHVDFGYGFVVGNDEDLPLMDVRLECVYDDSCGDTRVLTLYVEDRDGFLIEAFEIPLRELESTNKRFTKADLERYIMP